MAHFLYKLIPTRPDMLDDELTERETELIGLHFDYLSDLKDRGVVRLAGRTTNTDASSFGVVILEVDDEDAAREIMGNDPAVKENVLAAQLFPFHIALMGKPVE